MEIFLAAHSSKSLSDYLVQPFHFVGKETSFWRVHWSAQGFQAR